MKRKHLGHMVVALAALIIVGETSGTGPLLLGGGEADAVVGRPLTPVSYAGVARRTSRRTTRRAVAYSGAVAPVTALPAGCAAAGGIYTCGSVRYRAYYNGPTVVYQPVY
jgi:hypothetical protein